jgi:hypothetical protein
MTTISPALRASARGAYRDLWRAARVTFRGAFVTVTSRPLLIAMNKAMNPFCWVRSASTFTLRGVWPDYAYSLPREDEA